MLIYTIKLKLKLSENKVELKSSGTNSPSDINGWDPFPNEVSDRIFSFIVNMSKITRENSVSVSKFWKERIIWNYYQKKNHSFQECLGILAQILEPVNFTNSSLVKIKNYYFIIKNDWTNKLKILPEEQLQQLSNFLYDPQVSNLAKKIIGLARVYKDIDEKEAIQNPEQRSRALYLLLPTLVDSNDYDKAKYLIKKINPNITKKAIIDLLVKKYISQENKIKQITKQLFIDNLDQKEWIRAVEQNKAILAKIKGPTTPGFLQLTKNFFTDLFNS